MFRVVFIHGSGGKRWVLMWGCSCADNGEEEEGTKDQCRKSERRGVAAMESIRVYDLAEVSERDKRSKQLEG